MLIIHLKNHLSITCSPIPYCQKAANYQCIFTQFSATVHDNPKANKNEPKYLDITSQNFKVAYT